MLTQEQVGEAVGAEAYTEDGEKIGEVTHVYLDDDTQQPAFATVRTGLLGIKERFVPIDRATFNGTRLTVPYTKDTVQAAPSIEPDGEVAPDEVETLYRYYGLGSRVVPDPAPGTGAHDEAHNPAPAAPTGPGRLRRHG